ncbi:MAG: type IV secretion system protein [Rickettsiaceae bacterium]|nr:type IV secretion system protein [Rickettsiaceae bacterium]
MSSESRSSTLKLIGFIALLLIPVFLILSLIGIAGLNFKDFTTTGCIYRYPPSNLTYNSTMVPTDQYQINANGNYETVNVTENNVNVLRPDPDGYGSWYTTGIKVKANTPITLGISGTVSLCRGTLVTTNLASDNNKNSSGSVIQLPRVEDNQATSDLINMDPGIAANGIPLIFDAKTPQWRNLAYIELYDNIQVTVLPKNTSSSVSVVDVFASPDLINLKYTQAIDCSKQTTTYNPVCGLYTFYSGNIVSGCNAVAATTQEHSTCTSSTDEYNCVNGIQCLKTAVWDGNLFNYYCCPEWYECFWHEKSTCCPFFTTNTTTTYTEQTSSMPYAYLSDGSRTLSFVTNTSDLSSNLYTAKTCSTATDYYSDPLKFWATGGNYLLSRLDDGATDINARGSTFNLSPAPDSNNIIYSGSAQVSSQTGYLQYRFYDSGNFSNNTGGYVLTLKQTKCVRTDGVVVTDSGCDNRGQIQYAIVSGSSAVDSSNTIYNLPQVASDNTAEITPASDGYLAFRIYNNTEDYKNSSGYYTISTFDQGNDTSFSPLLNRLIISLKTQVYNAAKLTFSNMVCYQATDKSSCVNFFNYVKALLTLYISFLALQYIIGANKALDQYDLMIKLVKVIIVAGLLNDTTFNWIFNTFYPMVTNFTDSVISNISGYAPFDIATVENNQIYNPMMFLDVVFSRIFFSKTFMAQILATLSYGVVGILYFLLVCLSVAILLVTCFKMIGVYIMAFIALAILISMTPIFLTFLLFDSTKKYFDTWLKFIFHFALEPIVLMVGVIILVQLFTINLDLALGYSVCWKCTILFSMPFLGVGLLEGITTKQIFCVYWFGPWGIDPVNYSMNYTMSPFLSLSMISFVLYGYIGFSSQIMKTITGLSSLLTDGMERGFHALQKATINLGKTALSAAKTAGSSLTGMAKSAASKEDGGKKEDGKESKKDGGSSEGGKAEESKSTGDSSKPE